MTGSVLVFGGSGQLGQEIVRAGSASGVTIHVPTHGATDIVDSDAVHRVIALTQPVAIVNAAAYTHVDNAEIERERADLINRHGAAIVARASEDAGIPLIHISTDYVFDGMASRPYTEHACISPCNYYGVTKAQGEDEVRANTTRHVIIRVAWLYGEYGNNFLKTMLRLARSEDRIRVVNDQFGCPTSARELAHALLRIIKAIEDGSANYGTYHFAGEGETTWCGFADVVFEIFNGLFDRNVGTTPIATADYPTRARRPLYSCLDSTKFEREFGIRGRPWRQEVAQIAKIICRKLERTA